MSGHSNVANLLPGYFVDQRFHDSTIFKSIFLAGGLRYEMPCVLPASYPPLELINSDNDFECLMNKTHMDIQRIGLSVDDAGKKDKIRARANALTDKQVNRFIGARSGVIINATGRDFPTMKSQKKQLEHLGYDCYLVFVNASLDAAIQFDSKHDTEAANNMPNKRWLSIQSNMGKLQHEFNDKFVVVDSVNTNKDIPNSAWEKVAQLARNPITNSTAITWLNAEKNIISSS